MGLAGRLHLDDEDLNSLLSGSGSGSGSGGGVGSGDRDDLTGFIKELARLTPVTDLPTRPTETTQECPGSSPETKFTSSLKTTMKTTMETTMTPSPGPEVEYDFIPIILGCVLAVLLIAIIVIAVIIICRRRRYSYSSHKISSGTSPLSKILPPTFTAKDSGGNFNTEKSSSAKETDLPSFQAPPVNKASPLQSGPTHGEGLEGPKTTLPVYATYTGEHPYEKL